MTDKPVESTGEVEELKGPPTPEVSEPSAEKPTSAGAAVDPAVFREALKPLIDEMRQEVRREAQSAVDKRSYQFDRVAKYLEEAKGDPKQAARLMALDELVEGASEPEVRGRTKGEEPVTDLSAETGKILAGADIAFDDPDYLALVEKHKGKVFSNDYWLGVVQGFAERREKKAEKRASVGTGAVVTEPAQGVSRETEDDLAKELSDILSGKHGSAVSPENKERRTEIMGKLASLRR